MVVGRVVSSVSFSGEVGRKVFFGLVGFWSIGWVEVMSVGIYLMLGCR